MRRGACHFPGLSRGGTQPSAWPRTGAPQEVEFELPHEDDVQHESHMHNVLGMAYRSCNVVAGGSTQFGSSRVRKLIHVGWERGVQLGSVLYLENLYLGLATRAPLRSASVVRVLHEGLVGVGAPDVIPSDAQVSVPVGLVQA
ncbi:hypothetical protein BHE74_00058072 [Ensete ventricosum]|nr:hypothetical protein BHE74_00058072 [Ensete ventricosum]